MRPDTELDDQGREREIVATSYMVETVCTDCGVHCVSSPQHTHNARCIECGRAKAGVTYPWFVPVGEWHPTGGWPNPLSARATPLKALPPKESNLQWGCIECLMTGHADTPTMALALLSMHTYFACPAVPTGPVEHALRVARRADLCRNTTVAPWVEKTGTPTERSPMT